MPFNVNNFVGEAKGVGEFARPNLFRIEIASEGNIDSSYEGNIAFQAKSGQMPGGTIGMVEVRYMGRLVKYPGDRTWEDWTVTVMNDEQFNVRDYFLKWQNVLNTMDGDQNLLQKHCDQYRADISVKQYGRCDGDTASYNAKLRGAFPTTIGPIELSWDTVDEIETFDVTFAYTDCKYESVPK